MDRELIIVMRQQFNAAQAYRELVALVEDGDPTTIADYITRHPPADADKIKHAAREFEKITGLTVTD